MADQRDIKPDHVSVSDRINEFIQKNRRVLVVGLMVILVILLGFIVGYYIRNYLAEQDLVTVAELERRYEALQGDIGESPGEEKAADIETLLKDLTDFAGSRSDFAAARAWAITAAIRTAQKNWPEAEKAWIGAARAARGTYLAPIAFYNGGTAAEEGGNPEEAIAHYQESLGAADFPGAPRAQFSIGRIEETRGNREAALSAYNTLISKWPNDPVWTKLARDRVILLGE
jgi:tetratricopeptide (TPR) repeat protein